MPAVERFPEKDDRQDRERQKAVELAVGQIEKQFGKGSIMRLGQKGAIQPMEAIPTGAISCGSTWRAPNGSSRSVRISAPAAAARSSTGRPIATAPGSATSSPTAIRGRCARPGW